MNLSVLDLSPIPSGQSPRDALRHSLDLAREAEALGMTRFWVAEHHNAAALACSCPPVLLGALGAVTSRIRLGAGGVMLPNHSPLRVAEEFRVLGALCPSRVDLGLGRAPGTDPRTARALRRGQPVGADDFPALLDELLDWLGPDEIPREPFAASTIAIPAAVAAPEIFVLSSSGFGAELAARRGLGLAFAHHMNPRDAVEAIRRYRADFQPSTLRAAPYAILSAAVICAPTDAEAKRLGQSADLAMLHLAQGRRDAPLPSLAEASRRRWTRDEEALRRLHRRASLAGSPERVTSRLSKLARDSGADEIMIVTMVHDQIARRRSYRLVTETFTAGS